MSALFEDNTFPYFLVLVAGVAHIGVIIIVAYHSCCKEKCQGRALNNATSGHDNADLNQSLSSNESDSMEEIDTRSSEWTNRTPVRQVTTWQSSLLARVRARLQIRRGSRPNSSDSRSPGQSTYPAFSNPGASTNDNDELNPPSYDESSRYQVNTMSFNTETGQYEFEKPPSYNEVMDQKRRDSEI